MQNHQHLVLEPQVTFSRLGQGRPFSLTCLDDWEPSMPFGDG